MHYYSAPSRVHMEQRAHGRPPPDPNAPHNPMSSSTTIATTTLTSMPINTSTHKPGGTGGNGSGGGGSSDGGDSGGSGSGGGGSGSGGSGGAGGSHSSHTPTIQPNTSDGSNAGIEAGIGVGCAIVGAIIAAVIVWLVMRRKVKQARRIRSERLHRTDAGEEKGFNDKDGGTRVTAAPVGQFQDRPSRLSNLLPQPVDARSISSDLSRLQSLIRNHATNFYSMQPVPAKTLEAGIEISALETITNHSGVAPRVLIGLLADPSQRSTAVRFIVGWTVIKRLEPTCDLEQTLLPPSMAACWKETALLSTNPQDAAYLYSRWRSLTGYLLSDRYTRQAFTPADERHAAIHETVLALDAVLRPIAKPESEAARMDNLKQILRLAAGLGFTLASQPGKWEFDWSVAPDEMGKGSLVLWPTLVQTIDDTGRPMVAGQSGKVEIGEKLYKGGVV